MYLLHFRTKTLWYWSIERNEYAIPFLVFLLKRKLQPNYVQGIQEFGS